MRMSRGIGPEAQSQSPAGRQPPQISRTARNLHREAEQLLIRGYGPPAVIVDDGLRIVGFSGQTSPSIPLTAITRKAYAWPSLEHQRKAVMTVRWDAATARAAISLLERPSSTSRRTPRSRSLNGRERSNAPRSAYRERRHQSTP